MDNGQELNANSELCARRQTFGWSWKIEDFFSITRRLPLTVSRHTKSSSIGNCLNISEHEWKLELTNENQADAFFDLDLQLGCYVHHTAGCKAIENVRMRVFLRDTSAEDTQGRGRPDILLCDFTKSFTNEESEVVGGGWTWAGGTDRQLYFVLLSQYISPDKSLTLYFEIEVESSLGTARKTCERKHLVVQQLKRMLDSSSLADVTISTSGREFKAHKVILGARSPVLAAMFSTDMKETRESILEISDFDSEVVQGMLDYIYTGETPLIKARALELLQIANKYELPELKEDCEHALLPTLKVEGIVETLVLSYLISKDTLMPKVIEFMGRNKEQVLKQEEFQSLMKDHPDIVTELIKNLWGM